MLIQTAEERDALREGTISHFLESTSREDRENFLSYWGVKKDLPSLGGKSERSWNINDGHGLDAFM